MRRAAWVALGLVCVGLGGLGIIVPGLPTTVFFIGAAACFSKSSPRLEQWVLGLPRVGPMVRDYRAGLGMPRRAKVFAVGAIALFCAVAAWVIESVVLGAAVVAAGLLGVAFITLRVPTRERVGKEAT